MRHDPKAASVTSSARAPLLALIAIMVLASGHILAATDSPQQRSKPKARTQPAAAPAQPTPPAEKPAVVVPERPAAIVLDSREVSAALGNEVRSAADENMGRIVDMLVDRSGQVRAAIIDFGGFLGVGSRKIAVDWKALHFVPAASKRYSIALELSREQVKAAPEYKQGEPIIVLGPSGSLEPFP
jgi:hypothetical protein